MITPLHDRYSKGVTMLRRALCVVLALAALTIGTSMSASAATHVEGGLGSASAQSDLTALINAYRASNGLQAVFANGALTAAAGWMAGDMAARDYIGHVSSDGRSPTQRMSAFGYPATSMYTGEDLAAGYATAGTVLAGWQGSAAHNAVLLNPNYNAIGIGLVYNASSSYKWYWAADFGGPGGTVKVAIPPPPVPPAAAAHADPPAVQPIAERAAPASRGSAAEPAEAESDQEATNPEAEAAAARIAFAEALSERRIAHLLAVLLRMGAI